MTVSRWTMRRKELVLEAIEAGELSFEDACEQLDASSTELRTWIERWRRWGRQGLRSTADYHKEGRG